MVANVVVSDRRGRAQKPLPSGAARILGALMGPPGLVVAPEKVKRESCGHAVSGCYAVTG